MSLFRTRDLWQVACGTDEEFDQGSLCVGNVTNDADGARERRPAASPRHAALPWAPPLTNCTRAPQCTS
jgi:hypothetical protein